MSPRTSTRLWSATGFPRVSGDEPQIQAIPEIGKTFFPREQG